MCISLVALMIPPSCRCQIIFNLFFVPFWIWNCFAWIVKNFFFLSSFRGFWNCNLRTNLFNAILSKSSPFLQKTTCVRLSRENLFCSNSAPKNHIFNSWQHKKLLVVANQLQDKTCLLEINSQNNSINKLVKVTAEVTDLNLKIMTQSLWAPLLKNCRIWKVFYWQFLITYLLFISLKFWACYKTGHWGEFTLENVTLYFYILSWDFFGFFHQKIYGFIIFMSFFVELSNYLNIMRTNPKAE